MASPLNIEEDLTCPVCLCIFNKPKSLPCLHTFCATCISDVIDTNELDGEFPCPVCKAVTEIPEEGGQGLKDNFLANRLIEKLKANQKGNSFCTKHPSQELNSFCVDCKEVTCLNCMLSVHKYHNLVSPQEAFKIADKEVEKRRKCIAKRLCTGKVRIQEMKRAQSFFQAMKDYASETIQNHFERIRKNSKATEVQLLAAISKEADAVNKMFNTELQTANVNLRSVLDSIKAASKFLEAKQGVKKLQGFKELADQLLDKEWHEMVPQIPIPDVSVSCGEIPNFNVEVNMNSFSKGQEQNKPDVLANAQLVRNFKAFVGDDNSGITFLNGIYIIANPKKAMLRLFWYDGQIKESIEQISLLDVASNKSGDIFVIEKERKNIVVFDQYLQKKKTIESVHKGEITQMACDNYKIVFVDEGYVKVIDMNGKLLKQTSLPSSSGCPSSGHVTITDAGQIFCLYGDKVYKILEDRGIEFKSLLDSENIGGGRGMCCDRWGNVIIANFETGAMWLVVIPADGKGFQKIRLGNATSVRDSVCGLTVSGPGEVSVIERSGDVKVYKYLDVSPVIDGDNAVLANGVVGPLSSQ